MNVVDSSGWPAYFGGSANAGFFEPPILDTDALIVPTTSLFEVFKRVLQQAGEEAAARAAAFMMQGQIVDLDATTALEAARLSAMLKLPLASSLILATARRHVATLWTQDADFDGMDGVRSVPLA